MRLGKLYPQTSPKWDGWEEIYEHTVAGSAETSITISNLSGNTDEVYMLDVRTTVAAMTYSLKLNSDGTVTNYGFQYLYAADESLTAARNNNTIPQITHGIGAGNVLICAKSGENRTLLIDNIREVSGTTVTSLLTWGWVWNNSADEITSLVIVASQAGGLGVGSHISLYRRISA